MRRLISKHIRLIVPSLHKSCENFISLVRERTRERGRMRLEVFMIMRAIMQISQFWYVELSCRIWILTGVPESPESPFLPLQLNFFHVIFPVNLNEILPLSSLSLGSRWALNERKGTFLINNLKIIGKVYWRHTKIYENSSLFGLSLNGNFMQIFFFNHRRRFWVRKLFLLHKNPKMQIFFLLVKSFLHFSPYQRDCQ